MSKNWVVVGVPYGGGYSSLNLAKLKGTRRAPEALKKEFDRQKIFMADNSVSSWESVKWCNIDMGFGRQNSAGYWYRAHKSVMSHMSALGWFEPNILFLGGSHSITASTYAATARMYRRKNTGLVILDAHPDCCHKADWPIHSDWLRWLIENEYVLPENVLIIGLRQIEKLEKEFLKKQNIAHWHMNSVKNIDNLTKNYLPIFFALQRFSKLAATYLSIDIDVASGVHAPGTGCPSPGGFTDYELIGLIKQFKVALRNLRAADIVEINPLNWWRKRILRYDPTIDLGVKLIKEIIS